VWEQGVERHAVPPTNRIPIAMTTQPRPQGHSATRNVPALPPRLSIRIGEEGTQHPTPKRRVWHLGLELS
jgi:hypothetical protein